MSPPTRKLFTIGVALAAYVLGACGYDATFQDCTIRCSTDTGCPDGLSCGAERLCRSPGVPGVCYTSAMIVWRSTTTQMIVGGSTLTAVAIAAPLALSGDVLIATIAMGSVGESASPAFDPPPGWTLVRQTNKDLDSALAVYWHVFGTSESADYTWAFNQAMQGVAWISSYSGVSADSPIDVETGTLDSSPGTSYALPSVATTTAGALIVGAYAGHDPLGDSTPATWTTSTGTLSRANLNNGSTRSGLGIDGLPDVVGATPGYAATASTPQAYALMHVLALHPAP